MRFRRWIGFALWLCWSLQPVWWYFVWNPGPHDPDSFMFRAAITMTSTAVLMVFTVLYLLRLMGNRDE